MSSITLKVDFEGDVRRCNFIIADGAQQPMNEVLRLLQEAVKTLFEMEGGEDLVLRYTDAEGYLVVFAEQVNLQAVLQGSHTSKQTLRLTASRDFYSSGSNTTTSGAIVAAPATALAESCSSEREVGVETGMSPDLLSTPSADDEWTFEDGSPSRDRNLLVVDRVKFSMKEAFDRGNDADASFQRWLRDFHSERSDVWFSKNYGRLCIEFRPLWDEFTPSRVELEQQNTETAKPKRAQDHTTDVLIEQTSEAVVCTSPPEDSSVSASVAPPTSPPVPVLVATDPEARQDETGDISPKPLACQQEALEEICTDRIDVQSSDPLEQEFASDGGATEQHAQGSRVSFLASAAVNVVASTVVSGATKVASVVSARTSDAEEDVDAFLLSEQLPKSETEKHTHFADSSVHVDGIAVNPSGPVLVSEDPIASHTVHNVEASCGATLDPLQQSSVSTELGGSGVAPVKPIDGTCVLLQNLETAPSLNGQKGVCQEFVAETGRWNVRLQNGELKAFKPENLHVLPASVNRSHESVDSTKSAEPSSSSGVGILHTIGSSLRSLGSAIVAPSRSSNEAADANFADASARADVELENARRRYVTSVEAHAVASEADEPASPRTTTGNAPTDGFSDLQQPLPENDEFVQKAAQLAEMMESDDYAAGRALLIKHNGDLTAAIAELWPESA